MHIFCRYHPERESGGGRERKGILVTHCIVLKPQFKLVVHHTQPHFHRKSILKMMNVFIKVGIRKDINAPAAFDDSPDVSYILILRYVKRIERKIINEATFLSAGSFESNPQSIEGGKMWQ